MNTFFIPTLNCRIACLRKFKTQFLIRNFCGAAALILILFASHAVAAGELKQVIVKEVTASSDGTQNPKDWPHHPAMTKDGNSKTCWASSTNDTAGAWLKFNIGAKVKIDQIQIINGWIPEGYPDFFTKNHRAKKITLIYDNGKEEVFQLQDHNNIQTLSPTLAGETKSVTLRIDEIHPASTGDEPWVTISEVTFFSRE